MPHPGRRVGRRDALKAGAGLVGLGAAGVVGWQATPPSSFKERAQRAFGVQPDPFVPDATEGQVHLERVTSRHMGELDLFTAVPAGHGDGAGLPVIVVLHGSSASAAAFQGFGLGRFVTAAVEAGAPPFVLAGTDDGPAGWVPTGAVDPQRMLAGELPRWLADRGYAADRRALWGWSRGGYGALRFVVEEPEWAAALALFSPAMGPDDPVLDELTVLGELPWGLWCGEWDPFREGALALAREAPAEPAPWVSGPGGHTRVYWNAHTLAMFTWLAEQL